MEIVELWTYAPTRNSSLEPPPRDTTPYMSIVTHKMMDISCNKGCGHSRTYGRTHAETRGEAGWVTEAKQPLGYLYKLPRPYVG